MIYVKHEQSNTRDGKLRHSSHVAEWTEDNRYSFRVAFIELRVRRSTPAHGWLAVSPSPRPSWRPTTPVRAAGRDRCFRFMCCVVYHRPLLLLFLTWPDACLHAPRLTEAREVFFAPIRHHMWTRRLGPSQPGTFTATSKSTHRLADHLRSMFPRL